MQKIIKFEDINKKEIIKEIKKGSIFIYPTDTIYGLGCNALKKESIQRIRNIKKSTKPFSVIVPNKQWIYKNVKVNNKEYIKKLPGPYTFVFKMKKRSVPKEATAGLKTLGVRIPDHPFTNLIRSAKVPFITTSVNISSKKFLRDIKKVPRGIAKQVDFIIDAGPLIKHPSTVIDLTNDLAKIIKR